MRPTQTTHLEAPIPNPRTATPLHIPHHSIPSFRHHPRSMSRSRTPPQSLCAPPISMAPTPSTRPATPQPSTPITSLTNLGNMTSPNSSRISKLVGVGMHSSQFQREYGKRLAKRTSKELQMAAYPVSPGSLKFRRRSSFQLRLSCILSYLWEEMGSP